MDSQGEPLPNMTVSLRRTTESDAPSLSQICLLTGNAGTSAEHLHKFGELPGLVYAVPYVKLPTTFGFVMVDSDDGKVVGYILGSTDTRTFEREAENSWWPPLRAKYPVSGLRGLKEADKNYINLLHHPHKAPQSCIKFATAHVHVNILPKYQRQGWGKKLMSEAIEYLKSQRIEGVWLGLDLRNDSARKFYEKLGFVDIDASAGTMGMKWEQQTLVSLG
jgi:ribosomal protein S18 acetylase RimI-like enzyme